MKNAAIFLVSLLFAAGIGEIVLRTFTIFPVSRESSKIEDKRLGYRLTPRLSDVDENGFRNSEGKADNYAVAAFGDSHTYGTNVTSEESWPARFEQLTGQPTYNFGIGSYSVYTYHALFEQALRSGAKAIIIGLYPANDFDYRFRYCEVPDGDFEYWKAQAIALQLNIPTSKGECPEDNRPEESFRLGNVDKHVAVISALNHLILRPLEDHFETLNSNPNVGNPEFFEMPGSLQPQNIQRVRRHGRESDLGREETRQVFHDFENMVRYWSSEALANNISLGFLIITSRERIAYAYLDKTGLLAEAPDEFREHVQYQIELEAEVAALLERHGVEYEAVTADVVETMIEAENDGERVYPPGDGHPRAAGYRAYAVAAERLWSRIAAPGERR